MFIDEVRVTFIAGAGGDGLVSWRREKYIPKGGPRGGNGGNGGDIYLQTTSNLNTLSHFRNKKIITSPNGVKGGTNVMQGANGEDIVIEVPVGTLVKDAESGKLIVDLSELGVKYLLCQGGRGGYGNAHFATATRQAPEFAELGDAGEEKSVTLELKLVADIGIIGIPSAGKSSLIAALTNVKPKIGDYPFTTLIPNLGVLEHQGKTLVLEDVPGLIVGASEGKGLGVEFLKHIERTKVLMHMLDIYRLDAVQQDYEDIRNELSLFSEELTQKEEIIVFSKIDLLDAEMRAYIVDEFQKRFGKKNIFCLSSATGEGTEELKNYLISHIDSSLAEHKNGELLNPQDIKTLRPEIETDPKYVEISYLGDYLFEARGTRLEQIVRMTDFSNMQAVMRVYDVLEKMGVIKKIERELQKIIEKKEIDTSFFFEGSEDSDFHPRVKIGKEEIPLEKLKFSL